MGVSSARMRRSLRIAGFAVLMTATLACAPIDRYHGFIPPAEEIAALQIGVTGKDAVVTQFGPPAADRSWIDNTIYYAASHFEQLGPFAPREVDRQVLALEFDANDRLSNVARYTLEDGRVITLERRVTDDGIADVGFLSQLLGSLGRVDAGTLLGANQ